MDLKLLKNSIDILHGIRSELQRVADSSVIDQLDRVISDLEADHARGKSRITSKKMLAILGKFLKYLPIILELVEKLLKK